MNIIEQWLKLSENECDWITINLGPDDCCYELSSNTMHSHTYQKIKNLTVQMADFGNLTRSANNQLKSGLCLPYSGVSCIRHGLINIDEVTDKEGAREWLEGKGEYPSILMTHEWMLSRFLFCALPRSFQGGLAEGRDGKEFKAESKQTKKINETVDRIKNRTMFGMEGWKYMVIDGGRQYPFFTQFVSGHDEYSEPGYELEVEEVYHPNINKSYLKNNSYFANYTNTFDDVIAKNESILSAVYFNYSQGNI